MIATQDFATEAAMRAHYRAIRQRCFRRPTLPANAPPVPLFRVETMFRLHCAFGADGMPLMWSLADRARAIMCDVANKHGINLGQLVSDLKTERLVEVRHEAICAVAKALPLLSLTKIGRLFKRDHTTIFYVLCKHGIRTPARAVVVDGEMRS